MTLSIPQRSSIDRFGVDWRGRTVLVVGLGKSGLAACRLLRELGAHVRVTDSHDSEALRASAMGLREAGVERVELGAHSPALLDGCDAVILSPGIPDAAPPVYWARRAGLTILGEVELAFRFCAAPIVAVTGTNGKSSVVTLIQRLLEAAGRASVACGNLGIPCSGILPSLPAQTIAVIEVSSFQLLWCDEFRPMIAVLLNLGVNHLDRHHDRASYIAAKMRLFQRQTPQDYALLNGQDPLVAGLSGQLRAQVVWFGRPTEDRPGLKLNPATCRLLPANLQAVLQVGRLLGVPDPLSAQVIREFRGLEHRLESVATIRGVRVINDSKSTTPESLLYALERCAGRLVPIIGGRDKGCDFGALAGPLMEERIRGIVLTGESRPRLRALVNGHAPVRDCATLEEAVDEALRLAHPGDTVLFSPACASFDMFRNFEERGRAFKQLVQRQVGR
ncbi:MAG: UDP-N-acetylmuramoyl-L-alanine--D-glutamate ligase [Candidatus Omnitrophica bacterium]|nr:UDP-N-acetylmuramoyl-L-alanine--D-glutamate ligase [Candidatus Omnitrophota bacterium]